MKQLADQNRKDVSFNVGDHVFLKLQPYRQQTAFKQAHQKLSNNFYGLYCILERRGSVAYKLQLPEKARIHSTFHVSLLKKYDGKVDEAHMELPPFTEEVIAILEPLSVLNTRWTK